MVTTWVRRSLNVGALAAGALLVGGAAAQAGPTMVTSDNTGALNGTQALVPVQLPVNACGNAVGVLGTAAAGCEGGAAALNPEWRFEHFRSTGNVGIGNGTQVFAPVQAPVNVCGNAVGVLGTAAAGCEGGADAEHRPGKPERPGKPGYGHGHGKPDQQHPGYGYGKGGYGKGGHGSSGSGSGSGAGSAADTTMVSAGNVGLLNGTQVVAPVQAPVNVCGNAIAVLGAATAECDGGATATR